MSFETPASLIGIVADVDPPKQENDVMCKSRVFGVSPRAKRAESCWGSRILSESESSIGPLEIGKANQSVS
jgi:hypothetical protein